MLKLRSPNNEEILVTNGVAKQYLDLGFIIAEDKVSDEKPKESQGEVPDENEVFLNEVKEKPLSEWTKDEVQKFVKLNGRARELKGKNLEQAKELVKEIIDSEE